MNIPDNLSIQWYDNNRVQSVYEFDCDGRFHGILAKWDDDTGKLKEYAEYKNGRRNGKYQLWYFNGDMFVDAVFINEKAHGMYRVWTNAKQLPNVQFHYYNKNITDEIKKVVRDLYNITDAEKSYLALQYGFYL